MSSTLSFLRLIWSVHHALARSSARMHRRLQVTGPQRQALRFVGRFPGITAGQLARLLRVQPSTLTGIIDRLARRGFVSREQDARDGRRQVLLLTGQGRRLEEQMPGTVEAAVGKALDACSSAEVAAATKVLSALIGELEACAAGPTPPAAQKTAPRGRLLQCRAASRIGRRQQKG
jgi:DNA-binding MarR family transcriptional regulator